MENKIKQIKKSIKNLRYNIQAKNVENNTQTNTAEFKELSKQVLELENMMFQDKLFTEKSVTRIIRRHDKAGKQGVLVFSGDEINKWVKITEVRQ